MTSVETRGLNSSVCNLTFVTSAFRAARCRLVKRSSTYAIVHTSREESCHSRLQRYRNNIVSPEEIHVFAFSLALSLFTSLFFSFLYRNYRDKLLARVDLLDETLNRSLGFPRRDTVALSFSLSYCARFVPRIFPILSPGTRAYADSLSRSEISSP